MPMHTPANRRRFMAGAAASVAGLAVARPALAALPEAVTQTSPDTMPGLVPPSGRPYNPVVTLNGWTLPWRMNNGVKEFHLVAEPVVREMAPGFQAHLWGYNGQSPGPTIEVVEGDGLAVAATPRAGASCQAPAGRARLVELGSMSVPSTYVLRGPATAVPRPAWTIRAGRVTP